MTLASSLKPAGECSSGFMRGFSEDVEPSGICSRRIPGEREGPDGGDWWVGGPPRGLGEFERRFAWIRRQISRVGACETS
jgi:hypothetical protein